MSSTRPNQARLISACQALVQGGVLGAIAFVALVLVAGAISYHADRRLIGQKISSAIRDGSIQIPGRWDITDRRGIATFTDCLVLQALQLSPNGFSPSLFDARIFQDAFVQYAGAHRVHACDALTRFYTGDKSAARSAIMSYSRYWFGSATLASIALGETGLSIAQYRDAVFFSLILSLGLFTLTFWLYFRPASIFFTPYLFSICCGFSLLSLGQSIGFAPEEVLGLLILAAYNVLHIERRSLRWRAACYSFLGAVCVYLDLLSGVAVLVATILCCQWIASALAQPPQSFRSARRILGLLANLSLVGAGACFAVVVRLIGYSFVSGRSLSNTLLEWTHDLTYRMTGYLGRAVDSQTSAASLVHIAIVLKNHRADPFYGILSPGATDLFYALGFIGWILLLPVCWLLFERKKLSFSTLSAFLLAGMFIPGWFLILRQHTMGDAWLTVRLLSLFAGLGMSAFLTMFVMLRATARNPAPKVSGGPAAG